MNFEEKPPVHTGTIVHKYANNSLRVRREDDDKEFTTLDSYKYIPGEEVEFFLEYRKVGPVAIVLYRTKDKPDEKDMSGWT